MNIQVIKSFGEYFYFYAFVFVSIIMFVMMYVYPEFIAPLFDTYSPLADGDLKNQVIIHIGDIFFLESNIQIEELAGSLEFPLTKLFVVDGSKRSSHSNAYMYGFRKNKRIVLFDTLIAEECNSKQFW